jgi:hypothetical protein
MEMQQMIEHLLASQEQMMADREADQEKMERQIGSLVAVMEADRKTDRDKMKQEIRAAKNALNIGNTVCFSRRQTGWLAGEKRCRPTEKRARPWI